MNIVIPFLASETNQAVRWIKWVLEYCGFQECHLWLLPFKGIDTDELIGFALQSFKEVDIITDALGVTSDWQTGAQWRDSRGPNSMFRQAAWHFYYLKKGAWFYCEPDCIPIKKDAFDLIENEYRVCNKAFMGTILRFPGFPEYMNGVAVYPEKTVCEAPSLLQMTEFENGMEAAFDIVGAKEVLPKAHDSKLFQHIYYALPEQAPTFPRDAHLLKPETAFFHRNKDGTLIEFLRRRVAGGNGVQGEPETRGSSRGVHPRNETSVQPSSFVDELEKWDREQDVSKPRLWRKRRRPKKRELSPEHLAKLRANMQRAREAKKKIV